MTVCFESDARYQITAGRRHVRFANLLEHTGKEQRSRRGALAMHFELRGHTSTPLCRSDLRH